MSQRTHIGSLCLYAVDEAARADLAKERDAVHLVRRMAKVEQSAREYQAGVDLWLADAARRLPEIEREYFPFVNIKVIEHFEDDYCDCDARPRYYLTTRVGRFGPDGERVPKGIVWVGSSYRFEMDEWEAVLRKAMEVSVVYEGAPVRFDEGVAHLMPDWFTAEVI